MKRAVVTGGAGFLGSHLTDRLLQEGYSVLVLDNLLTGNLSNLPTHPRVEFRKLDITEFLHVPGEVSIIFHFASPASPLDFDRFPIQVLKAGALGTHKALGLAKAKGATFVLASTSEVYGDPEVSPQPESYWGRVNAIGPRGVYDEAKRYAEALTMAYHRVHNLDTRIIRFFNTYGPRMRKDDGRVLPNFVRQAEEGEPLTIYGDGEQTRCFAYVDDVIDGVLSLLPVSFHEPVNLGSDDEITVLKFASEIERAVGRTLGRRFLPALPDDPQHRRPDLTRIRTLTGWSPTTPLREGLRRTLVR